MCFFFFFFSSRRRHTRFDCDWSSDVCSSDLDATESERWGQGQDRGPIRQGQLLDPQAWVDLLKSYVVLDQVVRDQRLFVSPRSRADEGVLAGLQVTAQYRPGTYRLRVAGDH